MRPFNPFNYKLELLKAIAGFSMGYYGEMLWEKIKEKNITVVVQITKAK
jgi:hypothetical protein